MVVTILVSIQVKRTVQLWILTFLAPRAIIKEPALTLERALQPRVDANAVPSTFRVIVASVDDLDQKKFTFSNPQWQIF